METMKSCLRSPGARDSPDTGGWILFGSKYEILLHVTRQNNPKDIMLSETGYLLKDKQYDFTY